MIKLFRKIRQGLLTENKASRYLLYASGEIMLVVIGILIAFQVNTWNQGRTDLKDQIAVLKKLSLDLEGDYGRFVAIDSFYNSHLETLKYEKLLIYQSILSDSEVEKAMYFSGARLQELKPRKTAYDEMLHSGKLYKLSNENLVDDIIEYYRNVDDDIYNIRQTRNEFRAVFYGSELTEFWFWRADEQPFKYARTFFNNQNSISYKLLKQSAGWSVNIVTRNLASNSELMQQNRSLKSGIDNELKNLH